MMFAHKTIFSIFLTLGLLLMTVRISEANFEGTIGTEFTVTGSAFGIKKPKVYVEYEKRPGVIKKIYAKVEIWSDTSVTCLWTKKLPSGTYNLLLQPTNKGASPIAEGTFSIMNPLIDGVSPDIAGVFPDTIPAGKTITVTGQYFGREKPIVYLKDLDSAKRKRCRVFNAAMDPATGASSLNFIVPRWTSNNYQIILQTRVGATSFSYPLEPLTSWTVRNPSPVDFPVNMKKVVFGKGLFVAVGSGIYTSPDGMNWTERSPDNTLTDISYGNDIFVAVGFDGAILTSPDGIAWTYRTLDIAYLALDAIAYGNGTFVAVGGNGTILTSPDGTEWIVRDSGITGPLRGIAFGNGMFVAVGNNGTILTSSDGLAWTTRNSGAADSYLSGAAYGNGVFVVVGYYPEGIILTSFDGISWTAGDSKTANALEDVTYGNGIFIAIGGNGTILTSPDGTTWTAGDSGIDSYFTGITYGNGAYVVVGYIGISTSSDGVTWISRSSGTTRDLNDITYGNGTFVAVGADDNTIVTSPDGITWTYRKPGTSEGIVRVVYFNNTFIALAGNTQSTILTSPDGIEWTTGYSDPDVHLNGVSYGNGLFVVTGSKGRIVSSPDGAKWTLRDAGITDTLGEITFGNGIFAVLGDAGRIFTSSDGVSWTSGGSDTSQPLSDITYGDGIFVAVGENVVSSSTDGLEWKSELLSSDTSRFPTYPRLSKVVFTGGLFVSLGGIIHEGPSAGSWRFTTAIFSSADGAIWTKKAFGSVPLFDAPFGIPALSGIAYGNDTIVAVGRYGMIIQSDPLDSFYTGEEQ